MVRLSYLLGTAGPWSAVLGLRARTRRWQKHQCRLPSLRSFAGAIQIRAAKLDVTLLGNNQIKLTQHSHLVILIQGWHCSGRNI
jgi:hypothetical protein